MSNAPDVIKINGLGLNGTLNPTTSNEVKTPFLIGVAGGTASGKVSKLHSVYQRNTCCAFLSL